MANREVQPFSANTSATEKEQSPAAWLTLSLVRGMHSRPFNTLLEKFVSPENILACDEVDLLNAGLAPTLAKAVSQCGKRGTKDQDELLACCLRWLEEENHSLITRHSNDYPDLLAQIPDPPPLLFLSGNPSCLHKPQLAMVGSRNPSAGGKRNARHFARELATAGFGITSGLAMGIDLESHRGALDGGGSTVAVLGTGIDKVYPAQHKAMFEIIEEKGALVSEFNPGMPPLPANFPRRNRIISGLSLGVLVVEAGIKSGTMISARFALEQGREVFAIPGSIHNPVARGCHKLINEGAKLVQTTADIVEEFGALLAGFKESIPATKKKNTMELSSDSRQVLNAIGYDVVTSDALMLETGIPAEKVNVALVDLELAGYICREKSGYILVSA